MSTLICSNLFSQTTINPNISKNEISHPSIADLRIILQPYNAGTINFQNTNFENGQTFSIERKNKVSTIHYDGNNSISNAVYWLLDRWGFKFYGPTDKWTIKPEKISDADIPFTKFTPAFLGRSYFGTGGINLGLAFDPKREFNGNVERWNRRNMFNADYGPAGHTGEAFYKENKQLLESHSDWFTTGIKAGRFKIENPAAVQAYKNWIRSIYEERSALLQKGKEINKIVNEEYRLSTYLQNLMNIYNS